MSVSVIVGVIGSALTILAIWLGIVKLELARTWLFIVAVLELSVLGASLYFLGPILGSSLAFAAVTGWLLLYSVRLAMQYDTLAADAAIHWRISRDDAKAFIRGMVKTEGRPLQFLGLLGTARLAAALAKRARSRDEVSLMAKPVAMLCAVFHEKPEDLTPRLDELMRRFGEPAESSMHVADVLTRAAQLTPGSLQQVMEGVEALLADANS